jgi:type I restriction enzyme S subunit
LPSKEVMPEFLKVFLDSPLYWRQLVEKSKGTGQPNVNATSLSQLVFGLPPLPEQQRIVSRVEELFAQTRALAKELAHSQIELDGLNKSALSHLLASETPEEFDQHWAFIAEHFDLLFQSPEHITPLRQSILELAVRGKLTRREAGDESAKELIESIPVERTKLGKGEVLSPIKESENQFALPDGWEWVKLAEIAEIGTGVAKGKRYEEKEKTIALPYLRVANVQRGYLDLAVMKEIDIREDEAPKYFLKDGDLLLTEGGDADKLGRSAIWHGEVENCIHQNHIFRARPYLTLKSEWLMLYTNSPYGKNYFMGASKQTTNLASINKTQLSNCPIPFPPLAEQERIVKWVEQLLSLCDALEACLQSAEEERGRLVAAVMAGVGGSDGE